jgi:preprotein translocase subunit SecF
MINFLKYKKHYFTLSTILIAISVYSLLTFGLKQGIDFNGGTLIEISGLTRQADEKVLNKVFKDNKIKINSLQKSGNNVSVIRTNFVNQEASGKIKASLAKEFKDIEILRFESVGPILGSELLNKTITAAIIAVVGMLLYIAWAFKNVRFGIAAVLALLHDTLILIGAFAVLGKLYSVEVDALFVTAVLTTMSFSVHDTVVVFNKIREKGKEVGLGKLEETANIALTETMVRSINNSLTIIFMLLALILLGGESIRWFIVALLIGTILGTYSSPFVAVPILTMLYRKK